LHEDVDRVLINGRMRILVVEDEKKAPAFCNAGPAPQISSEHSLAYAIAATISSGSETNNATVSD
jgi:hypothetical protein